MSDYVVLRLLDSFFRHKILHVLPLIAFAALGVWYVATQEVEYQAKGVLLVEDETLLTSLSGVGGEGNGFQSPADRISIEVNSLLQTDAFVRDIAERAGLGGELTAFQVSLVRGSIGAYPAGANLVHVWANDSVPEAARDKAAAAIEGLIQFQVDSAVEDSSTAETVLDPLTKQYRDDLREANRELTAYLNDHPLPASGVRPPDEQFRVDQLTRSVSQAEGRYADALQKEESARLARTQAQSSVEDRFEVVDQPQLPVAPLGQLRTKVLNVAVFMTVGFILSIASVVLGAVLDQSVRYPLDVTMRLDTEVLGVIPDTSGWDRPGRKEPAAATGPNDVGTPGGRVA